jgi:hypothetical protein
MFEKLARFSALIFVVFFTTFSPQTHYDLPSKNHVLNTRIRKNPSKNAPPPHLKK